jgi:hypothetical protein
MSKRNLISIISAALVVLIAIVLGLYSSGPTPGACDINQEGGCTEAGITFYIEPRPVAAMKDSVFSIRVDDPSLVPDKTDLALHLTMPGMDMGANRFRLKSITPGWYSGKGVIPRCPSGSKLWRAAILDISARELAAFNFEVE